MVCCCVALFVALLHPATVSRWILAGCGALRSGRPICRLWRLSAIM